VYTTSCFFCQFGRCSKTHGEFKAAQVRVGRRPNRRRGQLSRTSLVLAVRRGAACQIVSQKTGISLPELPGNSVLYLGIRRGEDQRRSIPPCVTALTSWTAKLGLSRAAPMMPGIHACHLICPRGCNAWTSCF
jgi:hypothetical protein